MMDINELDIDDLIGAVCHRGNWRFFAGQAEWMLDYASYSPAEISKPSFKDFRGGISVVDSSNAEQFMSAMEEYELSSDDLHRKVQEREAWYLTFVVNFDTKLFVDGYQDMIPYTRHVPSGWKAIEDDPLKHVPDSVKAIWTPAP